MVQLLESQIVLTKVNALKGHDALPELVYFDQGEDEGLTGLFISGDKYADMGAPDKLTVTIVPGDRLNP